tara:strand:- start:1809 stop:1919 length:111 start_codon:yes stop_codon:yes gene_type:complete
MLKGKKNKKRKEYKQIKANKEKLKKYIIDGERKING